MAEAANNPATATPVAQVAPPAMTNTPQAETPPADTGSLIPPAEPKPADKPAETKPAEPAAPFKMDSIKLPDGYTLDEGMSKQFSEIATEAKLTPEAAQKLIDLDASRQKSLADAMAKTYRETNEKWVNEVKADAEIGGDKLQPTLTTISKALDTFGTPKVREALNLTGAGNNPEIVKTLFKMAKALTEGGHVGGAPASGAPQTLAEKMYPTAKGS